jgi:hypothetical protein
MRNDIRLVRYTDEELAEMAQVCEEKYKYCLRYNRDIWPK